MSLEGNTLGKGAKSFPLYIAVNQYSKRMEDELNMKPGDKIKVITDDGEYNDGWYYGRNLRTKEEGLYPAVFTKRIAIENQRTCTNHQLKRVEILVLNMEI